MHTIDAVPYSNLLRLIKARILAKDTIETLRFPEDKSVRASVVVDIPLQGVRDVDSLASVFHITCWKKER